MIEFEDFWREYPRKVGRMRARQIFEKIPMFERPKLMLGLKLWKQTQQWHQADGTFIPYASTFLAQKRYLDEPWAGAFEGR